MSPLPNVRQVPGPAPRDDEQRVHPYVVPKAYEAGGETLDGDCNAAQLPLIERKSGSAIACTRLDFDEGHGPPAPGNDIDFTARHARAASEDAPALQAQIPASEGLGTPAAFLCRLPVHFERSSARA